MAEPTDAPESSEEENGGTGLEETAREKLGLEQWDRPVIYRETADAAVDVDLPYWSVLLISGAIATLGLALDNAAVVIGAMLIAPLLAPVMGLALALAVGDIRLAVQTGITVAVSTAAVILVAALLTIVLPYEAVTPQITARTHPTTLDLGIAVFSGLAGGVVSVTRRNRLSAAIPGVAIAVALIPPLAVAGFAVGVGWRWPLFKGSMLLYGANLAGIVFSGTLVFLLVGMHRQSVVTEAMRWHEKAKPSGLAAWTARTRWIRSLGVSHSPAARLGLVLAIIVALAIPLTMTLVDIARETRVQRAVGTAAEMFNVPGRSSVLSRELLLSSGGAKVFIRVATREWFGDDARRAFEKKASAHAGEPVDVVLEQLPTSAGDLEQLSELIPGQTSQTRPRPPSSLSALLAPAWERVQQAVAALSTPADVRLVGAELLMSNPDHTQVRLGYAADDSLSEDLQEVLVRQLKSGLASPDVTVEFVHISTRPFSLTGTAADSMRLQQAAAFLKRYKGLRAEVIADTSQGTARADTAAKRLARLGVPADKVVRRKGQNGLRIRLSAASEADRQTAPDR